MSKIKTIGVLTSGGDSPGMNAAIRAVVRTAIENGLFVKGIYNGFKGLIDGNYIDLNSRSVSNIIQRGGTILKSARCKEFHVKEGREKAFDSLRKANIDGLIVIGGDGTFAGAKVFFDEFGVPIIGLPGTIDNDIFGTDFTIGFDTALNTITEAVDKIRDTAASHDRLFFIEVMGRDSGCLALWSGVAGGAEEIILPESEFRIEQLINLLRKGAQLKKTSSIVIVGEGGGASGKAYKIAKQVCEIAVEFETKVIVLGHIQRGGKPSAFDRVLASRLGVISVYSIISGRSNCMVGWLNQKIEYTSFEKAIKRHSPLDESLLGLYKTLSS